jgi:hypothetical protein
MSEPEQEGTRLYAFFRNDGNPMNDEARETWARVRDEAFPIPIVCGSKPPNWSMEAVTCNGGCHTLLFVVDSANDEQYLVHEVPVMVGLVAGMVDAEGHVNPTLERAETMRREASLN